MVAIRIKYASRFPYSVLMDISASAQNLLPMLI